MTGTATMKLKAIAILIVTGGMISHSALAGTMILPSNSGHAAK